VKAFLEREERDDQLGRVAERDVQEPADPRPCPFGQLLRRGAHEGGGRNDSERSGREDEHGRRVRQLEGNRRRYEDA
jgi:hypothetical protein